MSIKITTMIIIIIIIIINMINIINFACRLLPIAYGQYCLLYVSMHFLFVKQSGSQYTIAHGHEPEIDEGCWMDNNRRMLHHASCIMYHASCIMHHAYPSLMTHRA